jgi:hypothetical protein
MKFLQEEKIKRIEKAILRLVLFIASFVVVLLVVAFMRTELKNKKQEVKSIHEDVREASLQGKVLANIPKQTNPYQFLKAIPPPSSICQLVPSPPPLSLTKKCVKVILNPEKEFREDPAKIAENDSLKKIFARGYASGKYLTRPSKALTEVVIKGKKRKIRKNLKFFPAEAYFMNLDTLQIDTSVWKPEYGWLTISQLRWLSREACGKIIEKACAYFNVTGLYETMISLSYTEGVGSPCIVNEISGATGLFQELASTAELYSYYDRLCVPFDLVDRSDYEQSVFIAVNLFKLNALYFKERGYENCDEWGLLGHYTGQGLAEDTARYYFEKEYRETYNKNVVYSENVNVSNFVRYAPFCKRLVKIEGEGCTPAPEWARKLLLDPVKEHRQRNYAMFEKIRQVASSPSKQKNLANQSSKKRKENSKS